MDRPIRSALVVAHFHRAGKLRQDTVDALHLFTGLFDKIILVSTHLNDGESHKLPASVDVQVRDNFGYDFYSYRQGIHTLLAEPGDWQITLMNTSFLIADAQKLATRYIVNGIARQTFDFAGLTMSTQCCMHLQSYLLTFSPTLVNDPRWRQWWDGMVPLNERWEVIKAYELGLSIAVLEWGYHLFWAYRYDGELNPTQEDFLELLEGYGVLKVELIKTNPRRLDLEPLRARARSEQAFARLLLEGLHN